MHLKTRPPFASRTDRLAPSPIREILSVLDDPDMVSFAGGLPAADSFPMLSVDQLPQAVLQYGASEGDWQLRELVASQLSARGIDTSADRVLILSGSQQGIDLVGKLFVETGARVAVERPTYLAALQVFTLFGAHYEFYDPRQLELNDFSSTRLCYSIPTFQNPTGHCYSTDERNRLAAAIDAGNCVLFEDDPYRDLVYEQCDRTPVCSLLRRASWVYQSSFSKSLAPGLRLGYLTASEDIFPLLVRAKQAADLHSNRVCQYLAINLLQDQTTCDARLRELQGFYRQKRDHFAGLLGEHLTELADWQTPVGGLFFWLQLNNRKLDTRELLSAAIRRKVAFMPGEPFYAGNQSQPGTIRLNFSHADPAQAQRGLATLASLITCQKT